MMLPLVLWYRRHLGCCYSDAASHAMIPPPPLLLLLLYHHHICYYLTLPTNSAAFIHHPMLVLRFHCRRFHCRRRRRYDATGAHTIQHWNIPPLSLLCCRYYSFVCWMLAIAAILSAVAAVLSLLCCRCCAVAAMLLLLCCRCYAAHNTTVASTPIQKHNSSVILWHYHIMSSMAASRHWQLMLIVGACYLYW